MCFPSPRVSGVDGETDRRRGTDRISDETNRLLAETVAEEARESAAEIRTIVEEVVAIGEETTAEAESVATAARQQAAALASAPRVIDSRMAAMPDDLREHAGANALFFRGVPQGIGFWNWEVDVSE